MRYDGGKGALWNGFDLPDLRRLRAMSILERRALMASLAECDDNRSIIAINGAPGRLAATSTIAGSNSAGDIAADDDSTRFRTHRRKRRAASAVIAGKSEE